MVNKQNDEKIIELKKQIEEKKKQLDKSQKFTPVTNCSVEFDGIRYNIQVLSKEQIINLMIRLNANVMSAKELGILDEYAISGYKGLDWIEDLKSRLNFLNRKEEENKLKAMESKLDLLLSNEKKVELEIEEIASMLK